MPEARVVRPELARDLRLFVSGTAVGNAAMPEDFAAASVVAVRRAAYWSDAVSHSLFPMTAILPEPERFTGVIRHWPMGCGALSYFRTGPVEYRREREHLGADDRHDVLITLSCCSEVELAQSDRVVRCGSDQLVIERGDAPSVFSQENDNAMLVLKAPIAALRQRSRAVDRYSPRVFDARHGVGGLLADTLKALPRRLDGVDDAARDGLLNYALDLLALVMEGDEQVLGSNAATISAGHLSRAERFIRLNLTDFALSPSRVAEACGISTRYLHQLFHGTGNSVSRWIREARLARCHEQLLDPHCRDSIAEIACRAGFADPAGFSRHFRAFYGYTAQDVRQRAGQGG